ncbi:MAG: dTMP kinase [Rickettsiales bacterium]
MQRARFISLEGGEGCGKSTQAKLLAETLKAKGIDVILTREPGGEEGAEAIRELLVKGKPERWDPVAETLLFLASRTQHVERVIKPALAKGTWVISDRFHDSTRVYQGVGKGVSDAYYRQLHAATLGNFMPDLTFLLDIPPEIGLIRAHGRRDGETRFESMKLDFDDACAPVSLTIAEAESSRFHIIDAEADVPYIHRAIVKDMNMRFDLSLTAAHA